VRVSVKGVYVTLTARLQQLDFSVNGIAAVNRIYSHCCLVHCTRWRLPDQP